MDARLRTTQGLVRSMPLKLGFPPSPDTRHILTQCLPSIGGQVMPVTLGFSPSCAIKASPGRSLVSRCTLRRGVHAKTRITSIRANQHDTADRSDALSDEKKQPEGIDCSGGAIGAPAELIGARLDDSTSILEGTDSNTEMEMQGFVLGLSQQADAWDSGSIGAPVVRRYLSDNEERWLMWYSGRSADQQDSEGDPKKWGNEVMGLAISSNGVHWKRGNGAADSNENGSEGVGKVLDCSDNWWAFDTEITRPCDVLVMSSMKGRAVAGVYWMFYTGGSSEEVEITKPNNLPANLPDFKYYDGKVAVLRTRPGLIMSHDGRNWARIEGGHHSGSLFDVGAENEWDSLLIAAPHVVFFSVDDLRMYYHSFDQKLGCFSVGYARSRDAIKWVKFGKVLGGGPPGSFDELGVKCPQVLPHPDGNGYLMIYEGIAADGSSSFGLALSKDGLSHWERCSVNPVFTTAATQNAWDSKEIHNPCLVHMDGKEWCLYYQGVDNAGRSGIGMAICTDGKLLEFQRCHGLLL